MHLVHHQVTRREVGKALELLPIGRLLLSGGVRPVLGRGLPLGEHGKSGVLHPRREAAYRQVDLPRPGQRLQVQVDRRRDVLLCQQVSQGLHSPLRGAEDHGGRPVLLIMAQIGDRRLQARAEGGELLGRQGEQRHRVRRASGGVEALQKDGGVLLCQPAHQSAPVGGIARALRPNGPGLTERLEVLRHPPEIVLRRLPAAAALRPEDEGVHRQIVRRAGKVRIDQVEIPVRRREGTQGGDRLAVAAHRLKQGVRPRAPLAALQTANTPLQRLHQPQRAARGELGKGLRRRQQQRAGHIFLPPLCGRVKQAHRVHLVAPELGAHRGGHGGGIDIQDAAAQGKLPRPLHLVTAGIAHRRELGSQPGQGVGLPCLQSDSGGAERLGRYGPLHQRLHRGDQEGAGAIEQPVEHGQPPLLPLMAHRGVVEGKLPSHQHRDLLSGEGAEVRGQPLRLMLRRAEQQHRPAGLRPQSGGQMRSVDGRQPRHRHRGAPGVQMRRQLPVLRQAEQDFIEQFHTGAPSSAPAAPERRQGFYPPLYRFIA